MLEEYHIKGLFSVPILKVSNAIQESYRMEIEEFLEKYWTNSELDHLTTNWALEFSELGPEYAKSTTRIDDFKLHKNDFLRQFVAIVEDFGKVYWDKLGFLESKEPYITDMWANMHGEMGETGLHNHGGSILSGALYITVPRNSGFIKFLNPLELIWFQSPHQIDFDFRYNDEKLKFKKESLLDYFITEEVSNSDLLIWPSWLKHCTEKNLSESDRVVVSFNFGLRERKTS